MDLKQLWISLHVDPIPMTVNGARRVAVLYFDFLKTHSKLMPALFRRRLVRLKQDAPGPLDLVYYKINGRLGVIDIREEIKESHGSI